MHNFGQPPAPRTRNKWSQGPASARFGGAGGAYGVNDHPQSRYPLQEAIAASAFDNNFYSDVRPFEVKHDFGFCKLDAAETIIYFYFYGYGALLHYDLERHIRRYSSSKLRKMRKIFATQEY